MTKGSLKDRKRNNEKAKSVQNYFHQKKAEVDRKEGGKQKSVTLPSLKRALPSDEENSLNHHQVQRDSFKTRKKSRKDRGVNISPPCGSIDDEYQPGSKEKEKQIVEVEFKGTANVGFSEESDCKEKTGCDSDGKKNELRVYNRDKKEHYKRKNDKEAKEPKVDVSKKRRKRNQDESNVCEVQQVLNPKGEAQNICDSKKVDHEFQGKKKKRKKEIELEDTLDTRKNDNFGLSEEIDSEKTDSAKKKKKKKSKHQPGEASKATIPPGVDYLRTWHFDRRNWNFKKVRQVWLLQNMFDQEQISDENFHILLKYLEGLKGRAKDKTIEMAEQRLESETGASEQDTLVESRIRQVLQLLTD